MSQIDKRIQVNTIIENQLPEFVGADFSKAADFLKQYYISQEFQGGPTDLISNLDQYLKSDNLVPEVIVGVTTISSDVSSTDTTITVPSTTGFPSEYGLLKINDEIITYTGITSTTFTGCIRGFSGITGYNVGVSSSLLEINRESLQFDETVASSHTSGSTLTNLSVLFLQEFFKKLKRTFLPGLENNDFHDNIDVGNFVKFARSFYQSKGVEESIRILFKVLYGVDSRILDLEGNLIKPSGAEFIRREVIVADLITPTGEPQNLTGQTIFKSTDTSTNASVSEVEIIKREGKNFYKMSLFVGFSDRDLIEGVFTIPGKTKVIGGATANATVIDVDSTVGFGTTGILISGANSEINYTSKSINQFFGCSGIGVDIGTADDIRSDETIFGYENGDLSKRVDLRITGVLSELVPITDIKLVNEQENFFVKNIGEKIENDNDNYKQIFANSWLYNTASRFQVDISGATFTLKTTIDKAYLKEGDRFEILKRNEQVIVGSGTVDDIINSTQFTSGNIANFTQVTNQEYDIRRIVEKVNSTGITLAEGNDKIIADTLSVYVDANEDGYVASNSLPSYDISVNVIEETLSDGTTANLDGFNPLNDRYSFIKFSPPPNTDIKFIQGDAVVYEPDGKPLVGLDTGRTYFVDPVIPGPNQNISKIKLYNSTSQIGTASTVQVGDTTSTRIVSPAVSSGVSTVTVDRLSGINVNDTLLHPSFSLSGITTITAIDTQTNILTFQGTTIAGIGTGSIITVVPANDTHRFILKRHATRKLEVDKILRKIPLSQNLFVASKQEEPTTESGILINGVQIRSPKSDNQIFFGSLESIDLNNSGTGYDILNPPVIGIETSSGGIGAAAEPIIQGSVKEVFVDPQDFDIDAITSISLTGGNGDGCVLEPVLGSRNRELRFDSRDVFFNGGVDVNNETITFKENHNLVNGQLVYYSANNNAPLGIGSAYDVSNQVTGTLSDGAPYFIRVVNPSTVRIFNTSVDALFGSAGINTVGLSTDTLASGIHKFKTEDKNTLIAVKVLNEGSGYTHRKLRVKPIGISTSLNVVSSKNHGFNTGELIEYSAETTAIQGLSTTSSYFVKKLTDDTFQLADAGIGGTITTNFNRGIFAKFETEGSGFQIFNYPQIKVNIDVSYGSTVTGNFNITPVVTGKLIGAQLYEEGSNYGSITLDKEVIPKVQIENGKFAEFKPIIIDGRITKVVVVNRGREYNSSPELRVTDLSGAGAGAVVRPVIENGQVIDAIVTNTGIGYDSNSTEVRAFPRGQNGVFKARVRSLTLNDQHRFGDSFLSTKNNKIHFSILGYSQEIANNFENTFTVDANTGEFNQITAHSPIIGWAYDGNPIYGPFGYSDADDINSDLKILQSSYKTDISQVTNRPTGYAPGFFVEDHIFDESGDLDIHNGRFCKTPEFPNGIYAYFTTVGLGTNTNKLEGVYPYFIGNTYRSPFIKENEILDQDFDFNNSQLRRNTFPYNVDEKFSGNDFVIESYEKIRQLSVIEAVTKGDVDGVQILNAGQDYKIGDLTEFDDTDTNGSGFKAEVSEIVGIGISRIDTVITPFTPVIFEWKGDNEVVANFAPFIEVNDQDAVNVSGLSTDIKNLTNSFNVGVSTSRVSLAGNMTIGSVAGLIQDIALTEIPNDISVGGSIRIGSGNTSATEEVRVLGVFPIERLVRVQRNTGIAHTLGSNVDILNDKISIPVKTEKFISNKNDIVYFNGRQSVGIGTTIGGAIDVDVHTGTRVDTISIPTRTIRLPNHPFKNGQKLILNKRNGANRFDVGPTNQVAEFKLPFIGANSTEVFVINKGPDNIGLVTSKVGIGSTSEGLFFYSNGSVSGINSSLYFFETQKEQVTGDIDKIVTTVSTNVAAANTTTHNLNEGDVVKMNVVPNIVVGSGTTTPVKVNYNSDFGKLIINPITFTSSDVETNQIDIIDHGFKTGDKVFYDGSATGLSTGTYYVNKISTRRFQLTETIEDLRANPLKIVLITANTGGTQTIAPINPRIDVVKNSKLTFSLLSPTLADFDFKIFYDKDLTNEYLSSQDTSIFNVGVAGTIGIGTNNTDPIGAALTVRYSASTPITLYYGLTKGGFISTADTEVSNYSEIRFVNSVYNGEYKIFNVQDDTFQFSPKTPEFLSYTNEQCDILEYSTKSTSVTGAIKDFKILSSGFNYKKLPEFKKVNSKNGTDANIVALSKTIGRIKKVRIVDVGYEYSSDKTLSPQAFISPVVNIDNLDVIGSVDIKSGGADYVSTPNLIVFNPVTNKIVDDVSLQAVTPNQTISKVNVLSPVTGLDSVVHKIISINNSNGVGINSLQISNSGVVTCFLETPINGFDPQPFAVCDEIYVEGIQREGEVSIGATQGGISTSTTVDGTGYNSDNYNYQFFNVTNYAAGTQAILEFSLAGLTTNPGIAKTFQSGYATLVNKKKYPVIEPIQTRGVFELKENLIIDNIITDLKVIEVRNDYIKIDGKFKLKIGDRIKGEISNVSAEITSIVDNQAKFTTDFSNRQEYGWLDDIGKLNEDYQVIPDNDYYQNLSYTIKSSVEWEKFVNPVNRLVHPSGLKNFADTSVVSNLSVGFGKVRQSDQVVVLDVSNVLELNDKQRVDAINNFDFARDFDTRTNGSKFLTLKNRTLTDFTRCKTNRVLVHDDISENFSSEGFESTTTLLDVLDNDFGKYLIQIIDPDTFDSQFTEVVTITTERDAFLLEKTTDFTTFKLGDLNTEILLNGTKNLIFEPTEKFTRDHDIKVLKIDFNTDLTGIGTNSIGHTDLVGVNAGIGSTTVGVTTTTILEIPDFDFNGLHASIFVQDSFTKEINYNEVVIDFDGTDTTIAETYVDTKSGLSNSVVGVITARVENNLIKLQCENSRPNILEVRANIVGLGSTATGIGTYRFSVVGQPAGSERSARLESGYSTGTASPITYSTISKLDDTSVKSLVRVSCGNTSAIHQVISLRDDDDILTVQYPFVSAGSTTGIGTFGGEIVGNNINLRFYPDAEFDSLIEIQSYNEVLYTLSDFNNTPPNLTYGTVDQQIFLETYDGAAGLRANKKDFVLKHKEVPIYSKTFDPSNTGTISTTTSTITIPSHFFNTNEELTYTPDSTFIGIAGTAISIGSTANIAGVVTTLLPTTVYAKVINENSFELYSRPEYVSSGSPIQLTGIGAGNAHKLSMRKQLSKTIIGLDGVIQQPITFTSLTYTFGVFDGFTYNNSVGIGLSQFVLSGISSIQPTDFLKLNGEYMKVTEVGFSSTPTGTINDSTDVALGISTLPVVKVERGQLGIAATSHSANDIARIHRGSFNIVDSTVFFAEPPKGNNRTRRNETNLPFTKADFSGRTFLRSDYTTNMLFDDISDNFTGIGKTYTLTVGGANTSTGVGLGNGVLFINGVFQTPLTVNNTGNNYEINADTIAGISTVEFTGITSANGDKIISEFDINQNQVPRGGLIVSLGSTPGLGYAPLQGAKVKAFKDANGGITSIVGIATSSGFNLGIQTAAYDNLTGIITVTTEKVHGFALERPNTVKLKGLEFVCPKTVVGTVTNATYNPANGDLVITIANHGLVNNDAVILKTGGICFTCDKDSNATVHCYPRATDPAANRYLTVSDVTTNTFKVNVGASSASDQYVHTFDSADADAVKTIGGGGYVGVTTTIFQDHERPLFVVGIVSDRTFEVQAGASTIPHTYQGGGHAFEFFEDLTFGSGYRGGSVAIGVTDLAFEHRFVSAGIGSIRKGNFAATGANAFTATNAVYTSHTGTLVLTIANHGLTTSDTVGIDTGGLVFKCSKDNFFSDHPYPRSVSKTSFPNSDPIAGIQTAIIGTTTNTITLNVGQGGGGGTGAVVTASVGVGGTLAFTIVSAGTSYVNPEILIPEPNYDNLPVIGVSRAGIGTTTDTGSNLLVDLKVGAAKTTVGIASTTFEISEFSVARPGHSFKVGDRLTPVGLVTAAHLTAPIQQFELEVLQIFNDKFSAWQFGELDFIDSIKPLQDGIKTRFPLFFNGQLLSFEKDINNSRSQLIDLNAVLLIFVNGVLQKPGSSYKFEGGTTFEFDEAPRKEAKIDIFFYKGQEGVDVDIADIQQTVKIGDELRVFKHPIGVTTSQESERTIRELLGAKLLETDIYTGAGIDENNHKPIRWTKQKVDIVLGGRKIDKSREILEPQVYPTSKIIGDFTTTSGIGNVNGIFVDDANAFFYEKGLHLESPEDDDGNYGLTYNSVDALVTSGEINVGAAATAIVSAAGTISSLDITEIGSGYSGTVNVKISAPSVIGVGIGTTATATLTISNGTVNGSTITDGGLGYSISNPPQVIIDLPQFKTEKITGIEFLDGFSGIITGITTTTGTNGHPLALKFFFRADNGLQANLLKVGYPVFIHDTNVGNGLTSVDSQDSSVVGIGTTFCDNIYMVASRGTPAGELGSIVCNVHTNSTSSILGIAVTGNFDPAAPGISTQLGKISWGRLHTVTRNENPISIGVTGLTVNSGLTTFPTIQRKNYTIGSLRGLRSSGAIRVFGVS